MLEKLTAKMTPKTIATIKVGAVVVGAVAGAVVVGYVLYRLGYLPSGGEIVEVADTAAQAAL